MDRPALADWVFHASKQRGTVEWPGFVVPPNADAHAGALHFAKYRFRERRSFRSARIRAEEQTSNTQIKNETWGRAQIHVQHRRDRFRICQQQTLDLLCLWHWRHSASSAERIVRKAGINFRQPFERIPRRLFAYSYVCIV